VGVQFLLLHDVEAAVLSGKASSALDNSCMQLDVSLTVIGCKNKMDEASVLNLGSLVDVKAIAFCEYDVIDNPAMDLIGFSACLANAHAVVKAKSNTIIVYRWSSGSCTQTCRSCSWVPLWIACFGI